jgi:hypothetical protein
VAAVCEQGRRTYTQESIGFTEKEVLGAGRSTFLEDGRQVYAPRGTGTAIAIDIAIASDQYRR